MRYDTGMNMQYVEAFAENLAGTRPSRAVEKGFRIAGTHRLAQARIRVVSYREADHPVGEVPNWGSRPGFSLVEKPSCAFAQVQARTGLTCSANVSGALLPDGFENALELGGPCAFADIVNRKNDSGLRPCALSARR